MTIVTEIFILKMKEGAHVDALRESARAAYTALDGVTSWETLVTLDAKREVLYTEIYSFPDVDTAMKLSEQFSQLPETQKFLAQVDEIIIGRHFIPHKPNLTETT